MKDEGSYAYTVTVRDPVPMPMPPPVNCKSFAETPQDLESAATQIEDETRIYDSLDSDCKAAAAETDSSTRMARYMAIYESEDWGYVASRLRNEEDAQSSGSTLRCIKSNYDTEMKIGQIFCGIEVDIRRRHADAAKRLRELKSKLAAKDPDVACAVNAIVDAQTKQDELATNTPIPRLKDCLIPPPSARMIASGVAVGGVPLARSTSR